jgi:hypothetical protein
MSMIAKSACCAAGPSVSAAVSLDDVAGQNRSQIVRHLAASRAGAADHENAQSSEAGDDAIDQYAKFVRGRPELDAESGRMAVGRLGLAHATRSILSWVARIRLSAARPH